jgi:hypothetical protein
VHSPLLLFCCMSKLVENGTKSRLECHSEKFGRFNIKFTPAPAYDTQVKGCSKGNRQHNSTCKMLEFVEHFFDVFRPLPGF